MKKCWSGWRTSGVSRKTTNVSHDFGYSLHPGVYSAHRVWPTLTLMHIPKRPGDVGALPSKANGGTRGPRSNASISRPLSGLHHNESCSPCTLCDTAYALERTEHLGGVRATATVWKPADRLLGPIRQLGTKECTV
jgi:hypothetical protein